MIVRERTGWRDTWLQDGFLTLIGVLFGAAWSVGKVGWGPSYGAVRGPVRRPGPGGTPPAPRTSLALATPYSAARLTIIPLFLRLSLA